MYRTFIAQDVHAREMNHIPFLSPVSTTITLDEQAIGGMEGIIVCLNCGGGGGGGGACCLTYKYQ